MHTAFPSEEKIRALLAPFAETVKKKNSRKLLYEDIGFGREDKAPDDDGNTISIPVGIIDNEVYSLEFAVAGDEKDKPISYLLLGAPKMGKSSLIESMIYNGGMKYSPDDLQFYLIDFKDGVSAGQFRPGGKGAIPARPHPRRKQPLEEAEIILQMLENERARAQIGLFGGGLPRSRDLQSGIREKHAGAEYFPRIVIIIDEIQKLFQDESNGVRGRSGKAGGHVRGHRAHGAFRRHPSRVRFAERGQGDEHAALQIRSRQILFLRLSRRRGKTSSIPATPGPFRSNATGRVWRSSATTKGSPAAKSASPITTTAKRSIPRRYATSGGIIPST